MSYHTAFSDQTTGDLQCTACRTYLINPYKQCFCVDSKLLHIEVYFTNTSSKKKTSQQNAPPQHLHWMRQIIDLHSKLILVAKIV